MMTQDRAQGLIVGCLAASAVVAGGSSLATGDGPSIRMVLGVAFTGVGLATVAMFSPDLAGTFATLVLTTTVFVYGGPFFDLIGHLTDKPHQPPAARQTAPAPQEGTAA